MFGPREGIDGLGQYVLRLNQSSIGAMAKNELFVRMTSHIFVVELFVKVRVDFHARLVLLGPYVLKIAPSSSLVIFTLLGQAFDAQELG